MKAITAAAIAALTAILGLLPVRAAEAPQTAPAAPQSAQIVAPITAPVINPYEGLEVAKGQSCPGWGRLASQVGWPRQEIPMLSAVAYFESRCQRDALGDKGRSFSALQIHTTSWCRPNRYWPNGYLQQMKIVNSCEDLWDPVTTLRAGLEIWRVGGWKQWTTWQKASNTLNP